MSIHQRSAVDSQDFENHNLRDAHLLPFFRPFACPLFNHKMINAFLVFNGQGQPRLTKFYTQLVRAARSQAGGSYRSIRTLRACRLKNLTGMRPTTGHEHTTTSDLRNIYARLEPSTGGV